MRLDDSKMFGVLYAAEGSSTEVLREIAQDFSPRIEVTSPREIALDLGLRDVEAMTVTRACASGLQAITTAAAAIDAAPASAAMPTRHRCMSRS